MKNIAYMLDGFPLVSETFILQEILELKKRGLNIIIFARDRVSDIPHNSFTHPESYRLVEETCYLNPYLMVLNKRVLHFQILLKNPFRYMKTFLFSYMKGGETLIAFKSVPLYIKEMKSKNIHHVHAHFARRACTFSMLISMITGIPYSFATHAHDMYASGAMDISNHIRVANFVVTCTAYNQSYLWKKYGKPARKKVELNYHGVDTHKFVPNYIKSNNMISILSIGRLVEKKGFRFLVEAISVLKKSSDITMSVTIIGEGPQMESLKEMINNLYLKDVVYLMGPLPIEEVKKQFSHTDIFVLPSRIVNDGDRDGIPNVILEAMSMGLPVITTNVSGIPEVITNGVDGLLVDSCNAEALIEAINRLCHDERLRKSLGENARKRMVSQFHKDDHIDKLFSLFKSS